MGKGRTNMKMRLLDSGGLKLQVLDQELEQLKYCVNKAVEKYDVIGGAVMYWSREDLVQFAKYIKTSARQNPEGPGFELRLNRFDLTKFSECATEICRIYPQLDHEADKPTFKQLDRLDDQLVAILDQLPPPK
jgi:hypothetical protein